MIIVRQASVDDGPVLAAIDEATWNAQSSPVPAPTDDPPAFFHKNTHPRNVWVAQVGGAVAGYIKRSDPDNVLPRAHIFDISGLAVDRRMQRMGVGRRLVDAAIDEARRCGAHKVSLRVLGNNIAARRLYESCGFVVEGVLRDEFLLTGSYVDDVFMANFLER